MASTEKYLQYPTDDRIGTVVHNRFVHESRSCEKILCRRSPILPLSDIEIRDFFEIKIFSFQYPDAVLKDSANNWAKIRSAKLQMDSNEYAISWVRERVGKEWSCNLQRAGRELISPFRPAKFSGWGSMKSLAVSDSKSFESRSHGLAPAAKFFLLLSLSNFFAL